MTGRELPPIPEVTRPVARTLNDLLPRHTSARAAHPAVVDGEDEVSYGELAARVERLAAGLHGIGVGPGDRVGIHLRKSPEEIVATFALARLGAVFVNVNYQWTARQLQHVVEDCGMRALITDARKHEGIALAGVRDVVVVGEPGSAPAHRWDELHVAPDVDWPEVDESSLAALLYTSGSTGRPKGVMLSHQNIVEGARSVASYLENTAEDRVLGFLPMSFDYGMSQVTTMFLVGGTVVLQPVLFPAEILKTLVRHRVTGMALVPPSWVQVVRCLEEAPVTFPALRYVTNSGGKIPAPILDAMPRVLPGVDIYLMYGLTEAFRSTYLPPDEFAAKKGSMGRAIPGVEIFVVDPESGVCEDGRTGQLVHRGRLISRGYWGDPERSAERIGVCEHLRPLLGDEKVLFSGDLVHRDADGCLWFDGRVDEMIKVSGNRLSPTEVEELAHECGWIDDAVAFGVEDVELGQVVHLAVSLREGAEAGEPELTQFCRRTMPSYMVPRHVVFWDGTMPRTGSGKIDRPSVIEACKRKRGAS